MRRSLLAFLALAAIVSVGCFNESTLDPTGTTGTSTGGGGGGGGDGSGSDAAVTIFDNGYNPTSVTVPVGGSVTWTWTGNNAHAVAFDDTTIAPSPVQTRGTFRQRFTRAGTFSFFCSVHGRTVEAGTVTVTP
jgi:plastocyanin